MFSPPASSPLPSSYSTLPSPTADYTTGSPVATTEYDISALTPSFAQSLAISSSDEYSRYSNSSAPPSTPVHTLRRAADQLDVRGDRCVSETLLLMREAEVCASLAEHLRKMAEEASTELDPSTSSQEDLSTLLPLTQKK